MNARPYPHALTHLAGATICAAACLGCIQTVVAGETDTANGDVPTVTVYYGDLNLQRPASVASLYRRIQRAAERVCVRSNYGSVQQKHAARKCAADAIDRAVVRINLPALARYAAQAKAGGSEATG